MDKVAVCLVTRGMYYLTKYCMENILEQSNMPVSFYICHTDNTDNRLIEYCKKVAKTHKNVTILESKSSNLAGAKNEVINAVKEDYVCFVPINTLVNENWLQDLLYYYKNCEDCGILSIKNGAENITFVPIIHRSLTSEDYLENVLVCDTNFVEGIHFFCKEKVNDIGLYDESENVAGYEDSDYSFRFISNGYKNFYIRKQSCFVLPVENDYLFPKKTKETYSIFKENVEQMFKTKNYKK